MFTNQPSFDASEICKKLNKCEKIAKNRTNDISEGGTLRDISPVEMYEFYFRVR